MKERLQISKEKNHNEESVRLNRYLAILGLGSRRACDEFILKGKILVDGKKVTTPGFRVIPGVSSIKFGRTLLQIPPRRIVLLLNKPEGVVTTASDPMGRKTVLDLCRQHRFKMRLFPVGRLDMNSSGAILLTNDGLLCYRLTHPRFQIPKTYLVRIRGNTTARKIKRLEKLAAGKQGIKQELQSRSGVELVRSTGVESILRIVLFEGHNRQIRRMCESVGLRVVKLKRILFGDISIRKLRTGAVRQLTSREIRKLDKTMSRWR